MLHTLEILIALSIYIHGDVRCINTAEVVTITSFS